MVGPASALDLGTEAITFVSEDGRATFVLLRELCFLIEHGLVRLGVGLLGEFESSAKCLGLSANALGFVSKADCGIFMRVCELFLLAQPRQIGLVRLLCQRYSLTKGLGVSAKALGFAPKDDLGLFTVVHEFLVLVEAGKVGLMSLLDQVKSLANGLGLSAKALGFAPKDDRRLVPLVHEFLLLLELGQVRLTGLLGKLETLAERLGVSAKALGFTPKGDRSLVPLMHEFLLLLELGQVGLMSLLGKLESLAERFGISAKALGFTPKGDRGLVPLVHKLFLFLESGQVRLMGLLGQVEGLAKAVGLASERVGRVAHGLIAFSERQATLLELVSALGQFVPQAILLGTRFTELGRQPVHLLCEGVAIRAGSVALGIAMCSFSSQPLNLGLKAVMTGSELVMRVLKPPMISHELFMLDPGALPLSCRFKAFELGAALSGDRRKLLLGSAHVGCGPVLRRVANEEDVAALLASNLVPDVDTPDAQHCPATRT
jgi:hypothetical protein